MIIKLVKFQIVVAVVASVLGISSVSWSAVYYVSSSTGNDVNSGLSPSAPWKSVAKVNSARFVPGDSIYFKRGDVWREQLNPSSSGSSTGYIVFGAYDSGNKPSIRGSNTFTNWTQESSTLWYVGSISRDPGIFAHDSVLGQRKTVKGALGRQWDYWYDAASLRLYVYSTSHPAALSGSLEIAVRQYAVGPQTASYIIFDNLDIRHAYNIGWLGWGGTNVIFQYCNFTQSGGDHLLFHNGSNYGLVKSCTFDDWGGASGQYYAVHTQGYGATPTGPVDIVDNIFTGKTSMGEGGLTQPAALEHTVIMQDTNSWIRNIQRNTIEGNYNINDDGIVVWDSSATATSQLIESNVIRNIGGIGITVQQLENHGGRPNVIVRYNRLENVSLTNSADKAALRLRGFSSGSSVSVYYNTISKTQAGANANPGIDISGASGAKIYNNTISGGDNGITVRNGSTGTVATNNLLYGNRKVGIQVDSSSSVIADYNCVNSNAGGYYSGLAAGPHDVALNPMLVNAASGNFNLTSGSPCRDKGSYVGLNKDMVGTTVPYGAGTDIGAFEFKGQVIPPPVINNIM